MKFFLLLSFCILLSSTAAFAVDLASCGGSEGYAYFSDRGIGDKDESKWMKDKISQGKITLSQDSDGNFDVLIADATGRVFSSSKDGAKIIPLGATDKAIAILTVYPGSLSETYIFEKNEKGSEVMWTQSKYDTLFPKISAFVAQCDYFDLSALKKEVRSSERKGGN